MPGGTRWQSTKRIAIGITGTIKVLKNNLFVNLPVNQMEEIFETLFQKSGITIERIVSTGQSSPDEGWYEQNQDEWVLVVQGNAILGFEDEDELALSVGDYVLIPSMVKHKVISTSENPATIWLAIHIHGEGQP